MGIGIWQVVLILVIVLIIFGAGKLPRVMGDVAKGVKNFKAGMQDEVTGAGSGANRNATDAPGAQPAETQAAAAVESSESTSEKKEDAAKT